TTRPKKITHFTYSLPTTTASQQISKQKFNKSPGKKYWKTFNFLSFDDVLALVVNQCADYFEAERYVLPHEKHCLLRVMPYGLFLMDGEQNSQHNIFKSKKVKLPRFSAIFRRYPVVPLYGDMQITLDS